jgi:hypothetical protein
VSAEDPGHSGRDEGLTRRGRRGLNVDGSAQRRGPSSPMD